MNKKRFLKYVGSSIVIYIVVMLFATLLGTYSVGCDGMKPGDYGYTLLGTVILYLIYQYQLGSTLFKRDFLVHGLVCITCMMVGPILYKLSFGEIRFKTIGIYYGYTTALFFFLTVGQLYLTRKLKGKKIAAGIFSTIDLLALVSPFLNLSFYLKFNSLPTTASFMSLYYTDFQESVGFLRQQFSPVLMAAVAISAVAIWFLMYSYNKNVYDDIEQYKGWKITWPFVIIFALIAGSMFRYTYFARGIKDVRDYTNKIQTYSNVHQKLTDELVFKDKDNTLIKRAPGTVIVVIGESARRDYMKAFNNDFKYESTPWESQMRKENPNFAFVDNAYSSYVQTVISLERALTERSQYADKDFMEAINFVDIAKELGYHTYWFSNQGIISKADTSNSLIAKTSDEAKWLAIENKKPDNYDGDLLNLLKNIPKNQNNLVVLHIMGSHALYTERYPKNEAKFYNNNGKVGVLEKYANSLNYTDKVLNEVYNYGVKDLNLQAMIYFSDHAEDFKIGHNPDAFTFTQTRIPLWVYLSPQYQKAYPETMKNLKAKESAFWTNDMFYDLFVGILHAENNKYHLNQDLSKKEYNFTKDNLTTMIGKYKIAEDPQLMK